MKRRQALNLMTAIAHTGLLLIAAGVCVAVLTSPVAAASDGSDSPISCREETWHVSVMPKGGNPKYTPLPRHEKRTVLVCDEKVFAEMRRRSSTGD